MVQGPPCSWPESCSPLAPPGKHCSLLHLLHNNVKPPTDLLSSAAARIMQENKVLFVDQHCVCILQRLFCVITRILQFQNTHRASLSVDLYTTSRRQLMFILTPKVHYKLLFALMFLTANRRKHPVFWFRYKKEFHAATHIKHPSLCFVLKIVDSLWCFVWKASDYCKSHYRSALGDRLGTGLVFVYVCICAYAHVRGSTNWGIYPSNCPPVGRLTPPTTQRVAGGVADPAAPSLFWPTPPPIVHTTQNINFKINRMALRRQTN